MSEDIKKLIMSKVKVDPDTECWNWTHKGKRMVVRYDGKIHEAKRLAFNAFLGDVFLENIRYVQECNNRRCINPRHLKIMPHGEFIKQLKAKDFCKNGHFLHEKNKIIRKNTNGRFKTICRKCQNERASIKRKKNKTFPLICFFCKKNFMGTKLQDTKFKAGKSVFCCPSCNLKHQAKIKGIT